jgi:hypothetical protein
MSDGEEAKKAEAYLNNKPFKVRWYITPYTKVELRESFLIKEEEYPEYIPGICDLINLSEPICDEITFKCYGRIFNQKENTLDVGFASEKYEVDKLRKK